MKCDAVVLAAGYSSRAGTNKMALVIDEKTVLERVIETLRTVCEKIVVVGGHNFNVIKKITDKFDRVTLVENKDYPLGMFSSVKRGTSEMDTDFFLIPGDYPLIKESTYRKMQDSDGEFIVPVYNGRRGHPVLIRKNLISRLNEEPVESNLKAFRDRCEVAFIDIDDEGILMDIDTMSDYENIRDIIKKGE